MISLCEYKSDTRLKDVSYLSFLSTCEQKGQSVCCVLICVYTYKSNWWTCIYWFWRSLHFFCL